MTSILSLIISGLSKTRLLFGSCVILAVCSVSVAATESLPAEKSAGVSIIKKKQPNKRVETLKIDRASITRSIETKSPGKNIFERRHKKQTASLERMIGQMLVVGFSGTTPNDRRVRRLLDHLKAGRVGGVAYLRHNIRNKAQVQRLNAAFLAANSIHTPLIALDQEGGRVQRLTHRVGFSNTPSARHIAVKTNVSTAKRLYGRMAKGLATWGFNFNFGPVVDLRSNPKNPIIARFGRAYSSKPDIVEKFAGAFIKAHKSVGVITALKHFPGHGSSKKDTHNGFVDVTRTWRKNELDPYRSLIAKGHVDVIMAAHVSLSLVDKKDKKPATLSKTILTDLLRRQMGYKGVVISDDMEMGAIKKSFGRVDAAIKAIKAGNDILLYSTSPSSKFDLVANLQKELKKAALKDTVLRKRIEQSYKRVVLLKERLSKGTKSKAKAAAIARELLLNSSEPNPDDVSVGEVSPAISEAGTTESLINPE